MIDKKTYMIEHINQIKKIHPRLDQTIIERTIYAFGLLEALLVVKMPFVFKGGTSLLILLENPYRLSTDIDIIVKPNTDLKTYLDKAAEIFPFLKMEEHVRKGKNDIVKEHFKFYYQSPSSNQKIPILLDVLYEQHGYAKVITKELKNEFLLQIDDNLFVHVPTVESILGDKLTAFAPHTTGIEFEYTKDNGYVVEKTMEVIKQFLDVSKLIEVASNYEDLAQTFSDIAKNEIEYRGIDATEEDVLIDAFNMSLSIFSRGAFYPEDYVYLSQGIRKIQNHIYGIKLNGETAYLYAADIMLMSAKLLTKTKDIEIVECETIKDKRYRNVNRIKKIDEVSYNKAYISLKLLKRI